MFFADMHCDSLVSSEDGLVNRYNFSHKAPQLQLCAVCTSARKLTAEERLAKVRFHLEKYEKEAERLGLLSVATAGDLARAVEEGRRAVMFTMEGSGGLLSDSPEFDLFLAGGLRVMGLAWDENELTCSAWSKVDTGLTVEGKKFAKRADAAGIIFDLSHMSDKATEDLLSLTDRPVLATHSNYRSVYPSPRNLTDELAREVARRGGVIGLNLYPPFLGEGEVGFDEIDRQLDYALTLVGEDAVGFGFDVDGTDGRYPQGLDENDSIHDRLYDHIFTRFGGRVAAKIAGENVIGFLKKNL